MFNLGFPEAIVIITAGLLLFGPRRLPELAKSLGKGIRDFKKALNGDEPKSSENPTETLPPEHTMPRAGKPTEAPAVVDPTPSKKTDT